MDLTELLNKTLELLNVKNANEITEKLFDVVNNKEKLLELKEKALKGVKKNYNYNVNMKNFEKQLIEIHSKINGK